MGLRINFVGEEREEKETKGKGKGEIRVAKKEEMGKKKERAQQGVKRGRQKESTSYEKREDMGESGNHSSRRRDGANWVMLL
jgi:hypothetical protein